YERVCSGPGLVNIYRFLADGGCDLSAAQISQLALAGTDPTAVAGLDLMVEIYGAEAGNLALKLMATGGVYLGGGIPPRILPKLRGEAFMRAFRGKGRLGDLLGRVPVHVILTPRVGLFGAAAHGLDP